MSSMFTGIGIKTIDGVNIIEDTDGGSNNDIYDTLSPRYKSCRFLSMKMKKKVNNLTPPSSNISKFSRIDSISVNPVK